MPEGKTKKTPSLPMIITPHFSPWLLENCYHAWKEISFILNNNVVIKTPYASKVWDHGGLFLDLPTSRSSCETSSPPADSTPKELRQPHPSGPWQFPGHQHYCDCRRQVRSNSIGVGTSIIDSSLSGNIASDIWWRHFCQATVTLFRRFLPGTTFASSPLICCKCSVKLALISSMSTGRNQDVA